MLLGALVLGCVGLFMRFGDAMKQGARCLAEEMALIGRGGSCGGSSRLEASATVTSSPALTPRAVAGMVCTPMGCSGQGGATGNCFARGTPVATADGLRPIETIEVGDLVLARDVATGRTEPRVVRDTKRTAAKRVIAVSVERNGKVETIVVTPEHRFWTEGSEGGWVAAADLDLDTTTLATTGPGARVVALAELAAPVTVYNLEVDELHTYFVGNARALVHNDCDKDLGALVWDATRYGAGQYRAQRKLTDAAIQDADAVDDVHAMTMPQLEAARDKLAKALAPSYAEIDDKEHGREKFAERVGAKREDILQAERIRLELLDRENPGALRRRLEWDRWYDSGVTFGGTADDIFDLFDTFARSTRSLLKHGFETKVTDQDRRVMDRLAELAVADRAAVARVASMSTPELEKKYAEYEGALSSKRGAFLKDKKGRERDDMFFETERMRLELEARKEARKEAEKRYPEGVIPPKVEKVVRERVDGLMKGRYDWEKGFVQDLGDGWSLQWVGGLKKDAKVLYLTHRPAEDISKGKIVLVSLETNPRVLRVDFDGKKTDDLVKGGIELLGARGRLRGGSMGVEVEAMGYIAKGDITVLDAITIKEYLGAAGVKLTLSADKIGVGAAAGIGLEVEVNPSRAVPLAAIVISLPFAPLMPPTIGPTKWVEDKGRPGRPNPYGGYYQTPFGTRLTPPQLRAYLMRAQHYPGGWP